MIRDPERNSVIVVADTSPLNYLILLRKVEILLEIYGRVVVPNAVVVELRHLDAPVGSRVGDDSSVLVRDRSSKNNGFNSCRGIGRGRARSH